MIIDIKEYDITYTQFIDWVLQIGIEVFAINSYGGQSTSTRYMFQETEDLVAFKIRFAKQSKDIIGYMGIDLGDTGAFHCPYIPITYG